MGCLRVVGRIRASESSRALRASRVVWAVEDPAQVFNGVSLGWRGQNVSDGH